MANACASHGSRKTGPSWSRGMLRTESITCRAAAKSFGPGARSELKASRRFEIRLERVDRYLDGRIGVRAPELAALEYDGVEPLRAVALVDRERIGKGVATVHQLDDAEPAARVARQPGMRRRMNVPRAHAIARPETSGRLRLPEEPA